MTTTVEEFAIRVLKSHVAHARVAHTYLFTGRQQGKADLVRDFARALLCEKKRSFEECDRGRCRKISNGNHPDVRWVGQDTEERSIKIETVREMLAWANLKPYEADWKVFIFMDAERLTAEAQNALLKTLEEPPKQTVFCLLTGSRSHLFETIQSRSFEIRLRPQESESETSTSAIVLAGVGEKDWLDFLEAYQTSPREELKPFLDSLMQYFRNQILRSEDSLKTPPLLEAIDAVYETKEALQGNANQKLAMTHLTMRLERILPR